MAKKQVVKPLTLEELRERVKSGFLNSFDNKKQMIIPTPTRFFGVGEQVILGNLQNVFVEEILHDGKAYLLSCDGIKNRDNQDGVNGKDFRACWWFQVDYFNDRSNDTAPDLRAKELPGDIRKIDVEGLLVHGMAHSGLVCDIRFQRDYVWSPDDCDQLFDSIFDNMDIGQVITVSHLGYNFKGDSGYNTYRNLDGDIIQINKEDDYSRSIIDGQQRITTLWKFLTNKIQYRGLYFKDLNRRDQNFLLNFQLSVREVRGYTVTEKDLYKMFLQINRGVAQCPEHLAKIKSKLESFEQ